MLRRRWLVTEWCAQSTAGGIVQDADEREIRRFFTRGGAQRYVRDNEVTVDDAAGRRLSGYAIHTVEQWDDRL